MTLEEMISRALGKSDNELFADLGMRAYVDDGKIIHKRSLGGADDEENGKKIFEALLPKIRATLCNEWKACDKLALYPDESALALVIADTYITTKLAPFPFATLAVLTVRIGVRHICNCSSP